MSTPLSDVCAVVAALAAWRWLPARDDAPAADLALPGAPAPQGAA